MIHTVSVRYLLRYVLKVLQAALWLFWYQERTQEGHGVLQWLYDSPQLTIL